MKKELKIPTRKVKSDDCVIYIGREVDVEKGQITSTGTPYYIHKGEWVEVIPLLSIRDYIVWNKLRGALSGDTEKMEKALDDLCKGLSNKIVDWNWTDLSGNKLNKPYKNPDVFKELTEDELIWLSTSLVETKEQRKNASAPSA